MFERTRKIFAAPRNRRIAACLMASVALSLCVAEPALAASADAFSGLETSTVGFGQRALRIAFFVCGVGGAICILWGLWDIIEKATEGARSEAKVMGIAGRVIGGALAMMASYWIKNTLLLAGGGESDVTSGVNIN